MVSSQARREPDFRNIAAVLEKKVPSRPTLFEFFFNDRLYMRHAGPRYRRLSDGLFPETETMVAAFAALGYDYATVRGCDITFASTAAADGSTISQNGNVLITDRASFDAFPWPDAASADYSRLGDAESYLPHGMKLMVCGPGGVLENVISLLGYENLCLLLYDDPQLVEDVFERVGQTFVEYYRRCAAYDAVGALIANDDWGFNTQTMLSVQDLRRLVFPWHRQIAQIAHSHGKYAVLHSCGNYAAILDDILYDMKYDARHSYEDGIIPVETAYEQLRGRIAVLGGLDLNFMITASPEEIFSRARKLVERSMEWGGYALGTGNSVPGYLPDDHYYALRDAALTYPDS